MSAILNITTNGTQSLIQASSCYNRTAAKIGQTFAYWLILVVSLAGNIFIGIIVYKTRTTRKPINFLIVSMAMSTLLFTIFLFPLLLTGLLVNSWLSSGPLGEALCKLSSFACIRRLPCCVYSESSSDNGESIWCWSISSSLSKLVEQQGKLACELRWNEVFGESFTFNHYLVAISVVFSFIPLVFIAILYLIIYVKLKS